MRASKICSSDSTGAYSRVASYRKYAAANTLKNPVLSGSGRKLPRDARALEHQEVIAPVGYKMASFKEKLADDLKQALRGGDKLKCSVIRMLMASIRNAEIARQTEVDDGDVMSLIAKDIKQHKESIEAFQKGNRSDLVAKEEAELAILQSYLPQQMSREEIIVAARQVIAEVGAHGPGDKGKVMSRLIAQLKGKADGREINTVVTELLAS